MVLVNLSYCLKDFSLAFPQPLIPLISTELPSSVLTSKSIHVPLPTYSPSTHPAQPCCVSPAPLVPATSEILLVSQSCPSLLIWLSIPIKVQALTLHSSLLNVKVCPSSPQPLPASAFSDLPLLLWRTTSGKPTARLTASISNSFQIPIVHSFLKSVQEFSKLTHLNSVPRQIYRTLLKSLQEKLYFQTKV